jgi:hypothetical protein
MIGPGRPAGVDDADVEPAERLGRQVDDARRIVSEVLHDRVAADLLGHLRNPLRIAAVHRHHRPLGGEALGARLAEAGRRPQDEGATARQPQVHQATTSTVFVWT